MYSLKEIKITTTQVFKSSPQDHEQTCIDQTNSQAGVLLGLLPLDRIHADPLFASEILAISSGRLTLCMGWSPHSLFVFRLVGN